MRHTVYFGFDKGVGTESPELFGLEPDSLLLDVKKRFANTEMGRFLKCYAFQEHVKNTFIFRAPISLNVKYTGDQRGFVFENLDLDQQKFNALANATLEPDGQFFSLSLLQMFSGSGIFLLSEKDSLPFTIYPANFHKTDVSRFPMITGSYDCGKWFRPLNFSIINERQEDFCIKRGDPLFYIKFHTKESVRLQRVNISMNMLMISQGNVALQQFIKNTPLKVLYEMFANASLKKKLLKEIKKQRGLA